jgi:hypothetical protein
VVVGAQGIRKRRRKDGALAVEHDDTVGASDGMTPGDRRRVLGWFSWSEYTPGGALERNGFMLRQLKRAKFTDDWRSSVLYAVAAVGAAIGAIALAAIVVTHW